MGRRSRASVACARVALAAHLALGLGAAGAASADESAPELAAADLKETARSELGRLVAALGEPDRRRLTGLYVAFDPSPSDPRALAACDDDGDYVVVLSDAMLRLVGDVARAQAFDDANGTRRSEEYAAFLARAQRPARRLLPPPPGFYTRERPGSGAEERAREALAFVIARELAHLRAGDLACPRPTPTREGGDDAWTPDEERRAAEGAARIYPGDAPSRDAEATARVLDLERSERGALGLLRFLERYERERVRAASRFLPTYLTLHPSSATRAATVEAAAAERQRERSL